MSDSYIITLRLWRSWVYYFCARNSFTLSLCTIASLNMYAPVLGLRTALTTLLQFFASAAAFWSLVLIAVFAAFAMIFQFANVII